MISNDALPRPQHANLDSTVPTPLPGVGRKEGDIHPCPSDLVPSSPSSFPPPNSLTSEAVIKPRTERSKIPSQPNAYTESPLSRWKPLVPSPASSLIVKASPSDPGDVLGDEIHSSPQQIETPLQDIAAEPTEVILAGNIGPYQIKPLPPYPRPGQFILAPGSAALGSEPDQPNDRLSLSGELCDVVNSGPLAVQKEPGTGQASHTYPPLPHSEAPVPRHPTLVSKGPSTSTFNPDPARKKIEERLNAFNLPNPFLSHGRSRGKDMELLDTPNQEGHALRPFNSVPSPGSRWANTTPYLSNVRLNHKQHPEPSMILPDAGIARSSSHRAIGPPPIVASEIEPTNAHSYPLPPQMNPGAIESAEGASQAQGWMRRSRWLNSVPSPFPPHPGYEPLDLSEESQTQNFFTDFIVDSVIAQIYLCLLLWVPICYYSRVSRIFKEASLSMREIRQMALETAGEGVLPLCDPEFEYLEPGKAPPQFLRLKSIWEEFIDSVIREWKTCNIISVLLLSAILTLLQVPSASNDPVTRYIGIFALICALISLLFGCVYSIRFNTMRKTYKAAEWAEDVHTPRIFFAWNVYVFLAMPAIWLAWSLTLYISCILSFLWRTSTNDEPSAQVSKGCLLVVRIMGTSLFLLGFICGVKILSTFHRYGKTMETKWDEKIRGWLQEKAASTFFQRQSYGATVHSSPESGFIPFEHSRSDVPTDQCHNQSGFTMGIDNSKLATKPSSLKPISSIVPGSAIFHPRVENKVMSLNGSSGLADYSLSNPSDPRFLAREGSVESPPTGRQGSTPILPSQIQNSGRGISNFDNQRRPTIRFEDEKEGALRSNSSPNPPTRADLEAASLPKSNSH